MHECLVELAKDLQPRADHWDLPPVVEPPSSQSHRFERTENNRAARILASAGGRSSCSAPPAVAGATGAVAAEER